MKKEIESVLVKSIVVGSTYIDAKVVYENDFNAEGFERVGFRTYENEMTMPDGQYNLYRKGVDRKYRETDEWFLVYEGDRPDEVKSDPKKQTKLSKTMQAAINKLHKADWYYMHEGKTCSEFANENGFRNIGFESSGIVEGGYVYISMSSITLRALEKRGLIEVAHDGKRGTDVVKVVDMGLPKRIEKALMIKVVRTDKDHPEWKPVIFTAYATSKAAVQHIVDRHTYTSHSVSTEILQEVELTVWDFFANK